MSSRSDLRTQCLRAAAAVLCFCAFAGRASPSPAVPELRTTAAVRDLPAEIAAQAIPVRIQGMVTFHNRNGGDLFIEDATGGIFANYSGPLDLKLGSWVSVTGVTAKDFTNDLDRVSITELPPALPFRARPVSMQRLTSGEADCEFVSATGVVRAASVFVENERQMLQLRLENHGFIVDVRILDFAKLDFESLLDSEIRATGAAGGYFNDKKELAGVFLSTQSADQVQVISRPALDPYSLPLQPLRGILRYRLGLHVGERTHVRGTVTYINPGVSLTIQTGAEALRIRSRQLGSVQIGNRIDAVGFLSFGNYSPRLDDANFKNRGQGDEIEAIPLSWPSALDGSLDSKLVSIDAELLSSSRDFRKNSFALSSGKTLFSASLDGAAVPALLRIEPGSRLRVTGVCSVETDGITKLVRGYEIFLRSPADLVILSAPRFWSQRRLLYVVGGLLGFVLLSSCWVILLRRRVEDQTTEIRCVLEQDAARNREAAFTQQGRSRILEKINRRESITSVLHSVVLLLDQQRPGVSWCIHMVNGEGDLDIVPETCFSPELRERLAHVSISSSELCAQAVVARKPAQKEGPGCARSIPITLAGGEVAGAISVFQQNGVFTNSLMERLDLAVQLAVLAIDNRRLYDKLTHRSQHDSLTGLPNRALLDEQLTRAMVAAVEAGGRVAIAYVDLDKFKQVNDIYGHFTGDRYLESVAQRLRNALRDCDTLARVGGDEFIALITDVRDRNHANDVAWRLHESLKKPLRAGEGRELACSASIGLALFPDDGRTLDELKHFADESMYRAKRSGKAIRSTSANSQSVLSADELHLAMDRKSLVVHYQPIFSTSGRLTGFEALVRIQRADGELVPPQAFIGTAENSGLILEIGAFVLREASRQAAIWERSTHAGLVMAVNVSASQLIGPAFADQVLEITRLAGLPSSLLRLEITESAVVENITSAMEHLQKLRRRGIRIAIDDFGTGFANLTALQRLPFDIIKVDRSFIVALGASSSALPLLKAIFLIAESLNAQTVAEGVEFLDHVDALVRLGCSEMQGFGLAKPMSSKSLDLQMARLLTPVSSLAARLAQTAGMEGECVLELTAFPA